MEIRKTRLADLPTLRQIFDNAQRFMVRTGNPNQWEPGFPPAGTLERDIEQGKSYVLEDNGCILATFSSRPTASRPTASSARVRGRIMPPMAWCTASRRRSRARRGGILFGMVPCPVRLHPYRHP